MQKTYWRTMQDPRDMLHTLGHEKRLSVRKALLFAAGCLRLTEGDPDVRASWRERAAEIPHATRLLELEDPWLYRRELEQTADQNLPGPGPMRIVLRADGSVGLDDPLLRFFQVLPQHVHHAACDFRYVVCGRVPRRANAQCDLLRCLFPARLLLGLDSEPWLDWRGGTVRRIARRIEQERAFQELPVLADALEEAGCPLVDVIRHCRGPGPHYQGCHALDVVLKGHDGSVEGRESLDRHDNSRRRRLAYRRRKQS